MDMPRTGLGTAFGAVALALGLGGGTAIGVVALLLGLLAAANATGGGSVQTPTYTSSVQVPDQGGEEQGEGRGERGQSARLANLARIDATQAASAAVTYVPGTPLRIVLETENDQIVYRVVIQTARHDLKDVKVDAATVAMLQVDAGDEVDHEAEE